jgi:tRNA-Thr(GGU) m(6)t(6)A37 methyltransferase TsaA
MNRKKEKGAMQISFEPIGTIHTPFKTREGMPIQTRAATGIKGEILLDEAFVAALEDLDGFSHIMLIYYLHKSEGYEMKVKPFLDNVKRGLFATRAPRRPNAIGVSVVKLLGIEKNILQIENVDMLDGTPLLDIKPYIPQIDTQESVKLGWLENKTGKFDEHKSDERFNS